MFFLHPKLYYYFKFDYPYLFLNDQISMETPIASVN